MSGIRDRVAIVGMGCTRFGERWDRSTSDLVLDATQECLQSAGIGLDDVDAFWLGTMDSGYSGLTLSAALGVGDRPVSRVENFCSTGSEAVRNAAYAVASGVYDRVLVVGVEKMHDGAHSGIVRHDPPSDGSDPVTTAPAAFSFLVPAYATRYGLDESTMRSVLSRIAVKNHANGARNPRAQYQRTVSEEQVANAAVVAGALGVLDCSGVADGAAAALLVRSEDAHRYTDAPVLIKSLSFVSGAKRGAVDPDYDFTTFPEVVASAERAYAEAAITDPAAEIDLAEVHDCFTPTELVLMEDLGFSGRGEGWRDVLDGAFDLDGRLPVNPDGGLKSFGHPVGASGLRMIYECWLQLRGEAGDRQLEAPRLALTQNLGGRPGRCVSFVSIVGVEG